MSIEQTTQLIQLILNSVLTVIACALVLNRMGTRQNAVAEQLQVASRQCLDLLGVPGEGRPIASSGDRAASRLLQAKKQVRQLQHRHKIVQYSLLAGHYALLFAIASTFALALRALVSSEWLIPISLGLFVIGVAALLLGVGFTLIDMHMADGSLWEDVSHMLNLGQDNPLTGGWRFRMGSAPRTGRGATAKLRPASKARVS